MEYTAPPMSDWILWPAVATMLAMFMSWMFFGRRMARIEKAIKRDGKPRPCPWDGPGARIVWYAWALAFPVGRLNPLDDPFIDVQLVRRYSNHIDRVAATAMMTSTGLAMMVMIISFLFD